MVAFNITFSLVAAVMALSCKMTKSLDWRLDFLFWSAVPLVVAILFGIPRAGESPSFLANRGRLEEAMSQVAAIAKANGVEESARGISLTVEGQEGKEGEVSKEDEQDSSLLFSVPMMCRVGALATCFFACGFGYYGLTYSAGNMSDVYLNSALMSFTDILGYIVTLSADSYGRKVVQSTAFGFAGVVLVICGFLQQGSWGLVALAMVGRLALDVSYTTIFVSVVSSFPVSCRTGALVACQLFGRVGTLFAPFCGTLRASISCPAFGVVCLISGLATLVVPEQHGEEEQEEEEQLPSSQDPPPPVVDEENS